MSEVYAQPPLLPIRCCTSCHHEKPIDQFYWIAKRGHYEARCIRCCRAASAARRKRLGEEYLAAKREYYQTNEVYRERQKRRVRELQMERKPLYRTERRRARARVTSLQYAKDHPVEAVMAANRYRARKLRAEGTLTKGEWVAVKAFYGNRCLWCGKPESESPLTIDHVVPLTLRGRNDTSNVQPLCKSCNSKKKDRTMDFRALRFCADAVSFAGKEKAQP